jgi:hypothetical protein
VPLAVTYRPLKALIPYARNSRVHSPAQVAKLQGSLAEFGWTRPIAIADDVIVFGHGILQAALGMAEHGIPIPGNADPEQGPTVDLSHLSKAQRRAYVIADNRLSLDATWDDDLLRVEFADLKMDGFDLALTGFDLPEIAKMMDGTEPEAPADFPSYDEQIETEHKCPSCGYVWSGGKITRSTGTVSE